MKQEVLFQKYLTELESQLSILTDKSEENALNTLYALWHTVAGNRVSPIKAIKLDLPILEPNQISDLDELIKCRLQGVPLAHLTERQNFMGLDYIVNKGLYIPRKETELLAETAIKLVLKDYSTQSKVSVIDLCTGIGTVALAIANYCKDTIILGSDIYKPAIEAAIINAKHFKLESRVSFYNSDMFDPFESMEIKNKVDIIVSAPPYISTVKVKQMAKEIAEHEPSEAFDAGPFGLSIFNKLISISPEYLCNNGYLIFECGLGQGEYLGKKLRSNVNYGEVTEICDEHGNIRVLKARRVSANR
ncbi:protein-N(5)-glutamine methyltransferase PrmC, methylates polypeptide chain release factors RF1 and RF2 [Aquipluma nitroreducens]|uniref:peptide chain release factor N(5)-glutamine methyltransferase n=1 Tax=Aquipluma nitroreducens TaxID=2010828 RepID=A0A5K7SFZ3_9BACT|nr:peptide chain release factor N(5)-glutamine methyltransferase [Aquipluma nitroreducens]BBE20552.1 protein-N(5)-glutamine methyltransferase PrmC, methylates polypeptide chain release factors RF1 and RF2 [Aquipluma nitroreducens]